jgi:nucleoside-triphosphatase
MRLSQDLTLSDKIGGFFTEEFREKGQRLGFKVIALPGKEEGLLARKGYPSPCRVGKYGVNIQDFERIGCSSLAAALHSGKFIMVDEIGKMELFSEKFRTILDQALEAPQKLLATIMETRNEFADRIKKRKDVRLILLNRENFDRVCTEVRDWLKM